MNDHSSNPENQVSSTDVKIVFPRINTDLRNTAEMMLEHARYFRGGKGKLVVAAEPISDQELARIVVSLKLESQSPGFKLRAMIENWDRERIIREMY